MASGTRATGRNGAFHFSSQKTYPSPTAPLLQFSYQIGKKGRGSGLERGGLTTCSYCYLRHIFGFFRQQWLYLCKSSFEHVHIEREYTHSKGLSCQIFFIVILLSSTVKYRLQLKAGHHHPIPLPSINSLHPTSPISGNTLTKTNSTALYRKCLFKYASRQISNSPSSSSTLASALKPGNSRGSANGGISDRREIAQSVLICWRWAGEGEGGPGGGREALGKRVWRRVERRGGRRWGLRRWLDIWWWMNLDLERISIEFPCLLERGEVGVQ